MDIFRGIWSLRGINWTLSGLSSFRQVEGNVYISVTIKERTIALSFPHQVPFPSQSESLSSCSLNQSSPDANSSSVVIFLL